MKKFLVLFALVLSPVAATADDAFVITATKPQCICLDACACPPGTCAGGQCFTIMAPKPTGFVVQSAKPQAVSGGCANGSCPSSVASGPKAVSGGCANGSCPSDVVSSPKAVSGNCANGSCNTTTAKRGLLGRWR